MLNDTHDQAVACEARPEAPEAAPSDGRSESAGRRAGLLSAILFWSLCLTLTAGGHRLYKALVAVDRKVSSDVYQVTGAPLVWAGHGALDDAQKRIGERHDVADQGKPFTLPSSTFWLATSMGLIVLGAAVAWSGQWVANRGIQSLLGLLAGHCLWLGAIELGLDLVGRRLGLAGNLEVVGGKVVGTHGGGVLIQMSLVFLIPVLVGWTLHESNRCAVFQWFRRRLPLTPKAGASGRVDNFAARTTIQYFMTVWFCYVSVLWLADPRLGAFGQLSLLFVMLAIFAVTPYMIWRTACQSSNAQALRYSVSGAVVGWTAIEIAAAMDLFHEPWLSNSLASGAVLLGASAVLTLLVARSLSSIGPKPAAMPARAALGLLLSLAFVGGCTHSERPAELSAESIRDELKKYDERIQRPAGISEAGLLRALGSPDPRMRAQAAISVGNLPRVSRTVERQLSTMAASDAARLSQFAALIALKRLDLMSPELDALLSDLGDDPQWGPVAKSVSAR